MKFRNFFSASILFALSLAVFSCTKTDVLEPADDPIVKYTPDIPSGDRIYIHFGTSTQRGCMYSFSNCIWIGWATELTNYLERPALQFGEGDAAGQYFGQYFPLTADFTVDAATASELGIPEQVIPAGFYALRDAASGQATGKRLAQFGPEFAHPVASPVNTNNPQDNLGQLHNLAVQVVLHENLDAFKALKGDREGTRKLLTEKLIAFFEQAELPIPAADRQFAQSTDLYRDYHNYAARVEETRLSDNDKKALLAVFDEASGIPVNSPESLSQFVKTLTERENQLAAAGLDDPKTVLSMISVLKYSRYYWFWRAFSNGQTGGGSTDAGLIPDWVWADVIGMELGGPLVSALASSAVYLDQR